MEKQDSNMSMNEQGRTYYTVAWFDGVAERFHSEVLHNSNKAVEYYKQIKSETRLVSRGDEILLKDFIDEAKFDKLCKML